MAAKPAKRKQARKATPGRKRRGQVESQATVIPQGATAETPAGGPGTANEPAPAPAPAPQESAQELREKVEATKRVEEVAPIPSSKEEVERLKRMGLREYAVKGTALMLVGLIDPKAAPTTVEQRVEMARRLNEVGPRLPRYILHLYDQKRPESSAKAILQVSQNIHDGDAMRAKKQEEQQKKEKPSKKPAPAAKPAKPAKPTPATEQAAKKAAAKQEAKPNGGGGIGGLVRRMLKQGKTTEDILKAVKQEFPSSKTTPASVAWYRSDMRGKGELPKS